MSTPNRSALLNKIYRVLKKHYKPMAARHDQPVLESLLYASCLENTSPAMAERVYAAIKASFFDWNEVRVSTVKELAEVMAPVANPTQAATRLKSILQNVFESDYSFDLEGLKKQNLGQAIKRLAKLPGASQFIVSYATQTSLGGHSVPIDEAALETFYAVGLINQQERASGTVTGLERAIPKSKGQEFGSLLHQLAADYFGNLHSQPIRDILLSISPDAKDRFPKRGVKKPVLAPVVEAPKSAKAPTSEKAHAGAKGKPDAKADKSRRPEPTTKHTSKDHASKEKDKKKPAPPAKKQPPRGKPLARKKPR